MKKIMVVEVKVVHVKDYHQFQNVDHLLLALNLANVVQVQMLVQVAKMDVDQVLFVE